ncbi:MAG: gliding motility-associated C-terminal domain-containing protein [Bacteroidota bacterium]|nr:gliding motility-associated C-terminal domain-containing protein [Bacteroidota bacterium]
MKNNVLLFLFAAITSIFRGQGIVVQNAGNLCIGNHERIQSSAYPSFKTQGINFDTVHVFPSTAGFLSNSHMKLFLSSSNGTNTSPSFTNMTAIYYHPSTIKGNAVSGRFNSDRLTDYALINSFGSIITLKNTGFPLQFNKDSLDESFLGGHVCSKLLQCNLDGLSPLDLVSVGVKSIATQSFVVRPYINATATGTTAILSFSGQPLKTITNMLSFTNYNFDVEAGDLDNNGKDELIFVSEVLDSIYVLYSLFGTLDKQFQFSPGPGFIHKKIVLSDLDGDGKKEIALSGKINPSGLHYVAVYSPFYVLGNLAGFNPLNTVYTNYEISDFNFADLNTDGFKDLIVSQATPTASTFGSINVYMHNRVSLFQFTNAPINFQMNGHITGGLAVWDVDNNKRPDIISFPNSDTSSIVILKNFTHRDSLYAVPSRTAICLGDTFVLKNQLIGFNGVYFTNIVPSLSVIATTNHTTSITSSGNYTVNAMYSPYVGGTCVFVSNNVNIKQGLQSNVIVSGPNSVCYNSPVILTAGGAASFTWATSSQTTNANSLSFTPTTSVAYVLTGSSIDGCKSVANGTVNVKPEVNATITYDKNFLCKDQKASLTASGGITYTWSTGETQPSIAITQTSSVAQVYNVYVTNGDGCSKYASFTTNYNDKCKEVIVIKGITPNSDGENDQLYIENIENYPDNVVSIYNRWGVMLYTQKGYDNTTKSWPSKTQNNLASGTYYYVVELGPGNDVKKGWIEIFSN